MPLSLLAHAVLLPLHPLGFLLPWAHFLVVGSVPLAWACWVLGLVGLLAVCGAPKAVEEYLRQRGYILNEIRSSAGPLVAAIGASAAEDSLQNTRALFLLRVHGQQVEALYQSLTLGEYAPTAIRWIALSDSGPPGVVITFGYNEIPEVGTMILALRDGGMVETYVDGTVTCRAAEIRDIDDDPALELISYASDLSGGTAAALAM